MNPDRIKQLEAQLDSITRERDLLRVQVQQLTKTVEEQKETISQLKGVSDQSKLPSSVVTTPINPEMKGNEVIAVPPRLRSTRASEQANVSSPKRTGFTDQNTPLKPTFIESSVLQLAIQQDPRFEILKTPKDYSLVIASTRNISSQNSLVAVIVDIAIRDVKREADLWRIQKTYQNIISLHSEIRMFVSEFPDSSVFMGVSPTKYAHRKLALRDYFGKIQEECGDKDPVLAFLTSNVTPLPSIAVPQKLTGGMEGYLLRKTSDNNEWKSLYFILRHGILDAFEEKDKEFHSTLKLKYCIISQMPDNTNEDILHGILIVEYPSTLGTPDASKPPSDVTVMGKYILCAENEAEKELWYTHIEAHATKIRLLANKAVGRQPLVNVSAPASDAASPRAGSDNNLVKTSAKSLPHVPQVSVSPSLSNNSSSVFDSSSQIIQPPSLPPRDLNISAPQNPTNPPSFPSRGSSVEYLASLNSTEQSTSTGRLPQVEMANHPALALLNNPQDSTNSIKNYHDDNDRIMASKPPPRLMDLQESQSIAPASSSSLMINRRPIVNEKEKKGIGSFFNRKKSAFASTPAVNASQETLPKRVFGVPIAQAVAVSKIAEDFPIPAVIFRCIEFLEIKNAFTEEGLYRLSGSALIIQTLKEKFNTDGDVNILQVEGSIDAHAVAGLLKLYFRELPEPLLTIELQKEFLQVMKIMDRNERVLLLKKLTSSLPLTNLVLLRVLIAHLIHVVQHSEQNKMNARNISIVFSPTLNIGAGILTLMMAEYDIIFGNGTLQGNGLLVESEEGSNTTKSENNASQGHQQTDSGQSAQSFLFEPIVPAPRKSSKPKYDVALGLLPVEFGTMDLESEITEALSRHESETSLIPGSNLHSKTSSQEDIRLGIPSRSASKKEKKLSVIDDSATPESEQSPDDDAEEVVIAD